MIKFKMLKIILRDLNQTATNPNFLLKSTRAGTKKQLDSVI